MGACLVTDHIREVGEGALDVEKAGTLMNAVDKALGGTLPKTLEDM